jgi:LacI family transcriptional regulator
MAKFSQNAERRVTQQDVADAVGVSHVTVSQVLHQSRRSRVSAETQEKIFRMARQMGYQPRNDTTHTLAVVVEPGSLWFDATAAILTHADEILRGVGYRTSVSTLDEGAMREAKTLFHQKSVDGVLFTQWHAGMEKHLAKLQVPFLLLADTDQAPSSIDQVAMDTIATAGELTRHLLEQGHEYFCVVTGRAGIGMHERVKRGVFETLKAAGVPEKNVSVIHDRQDDAFERKLLWLMNQKKPPTAFVAGGPGSAFVTLNRLQVNGFRVPRDASIVSLMDSPRLTALNPKITATDALGYDHIKLACERLLARIKRPTLTPERILVPGAIIERESVAAPRRA